MSVIDDKADATCCVCDERVELYAPGESYKMIGGQPAHVPCAREFALSGIPSHRVVNAARQCCDTCEKVLYDCRCPVFQPCPLCGLSIEDAEYVAVETSSPDCEYSPIGLHDWIEEER